MKKSYSGAVPLLIMGGILVLGFQNCGNSSFNNSDLVQDAPLSSISTEDINDTQFKTGFSFNYLVKTDTQTLSEFQIRKTDAQVYSALEGNKIITCMLENPNSMEELMQITDVATVTHPTFLSNPDICDPADGRFIHFKIGDVSPIYLIASSQSDNCLLDDPQRFLDENKRVFIIDNLSFEEIETLVDESKALAQSASCTVSVLNIE